MVNVVSWFSNLQNIEWAYKFIMGSKEVSEPGLVIRLRAADDVNGLTGAGGDFPVAIIVDTQGRQIGITGKNQQYVDQSEQAELSVMVDKRSEIKWIRLASTNRNQNAICISSIAWKISDKHPNHEARSGAIVGDIFQACGAPWYYSGQQIVVDGAWQNVNCVWLDSDKSPGPTTARSFSINTSTYGRNPQNYLTRTSMCEGPLTSDHYLADANPWNWITEFAKESRPREKVDYNKIYVSKTYSAKDLCSDSKSWGPHLYSVKEDKLCDMNTKQLLSQCKPGQKDCFINVNGTVAFNYQNNSLLKQNLKISSLSPDVW